MFTGNKLIIAGSSVIENSQAAKIPTAVMLPRCQKGGESEKLSARKPTIVVIEVIVELVELVVFSVPVDELLEVL